MTADMQPKAMKIRWEDLERGDVGPGWARSGFANDKAQFMFNWLEPGSGSLEPHVHDFDQFALILEGTCLMVADGVEYMIEAGEMLFIPAGVWHGGEARGDVPVVNLDVFCPPRQDYASFQDQRYDMTKSSPEVADVGDTSARLD